MKIITCFLCLATALSLACTRPKQYTHRWVYAFGSTVETEAGLKQLKAIADTAAAHGLNGFVLPGREDRIDNRPPEYLKRLKELDAYLKEKNLELIPAIMSFSWGDAVYEDNRNLTAGLPVKDALFIVKDGMAHPAREFKVALKNANFEQHYSNGFPEWLSGEGADKILSSEESSAGEGNTSLRIRIDHNFPNEDPVLTQKTDVQPHHLYRISYRLKLKHLNNNAWGVFPIQVKGEDGRSLHYQIPHMSVDGKWHEYTIGFNSLNYERVRVMITSPATPEAEYLVDDLKIEEAGLINVLRRPGTPVTVRGDDNGVVYTEGKDYEKIIDPFRIDSMWNETIDFRFDHADPPVKILAGSRIRNGEKLRLSWYHPLYIYGGAFPMCMSEPEVYALLQKKVERIHEALAPKSYLVSIEEIRGGNTCAACSARQISMAEMLADCVHKCAAIIKASNPDAKCYLWGDLFDPNHNGSEREGKNYFHVHGNYDHSWKYIPGDFIMIPWWDEIMDKSLEHYDSLGLNMISSFCFDNENALEKIKITMELSEKYDRHLGFMYSTWGNKFDRLGVFGDLLKPKN